MRPTLLAAVVGCICFLLASASAQVVTLANGIATYDPQGTTLNGTDFGAFLHNIQTQATGVRLVPDTYQVLPNAPVGYHVELKCPSSRTGTFTIDLSGSTFIYTDHRYSVWNTYSCFNVVIIGPDVGDYRPDQYPIAQGTVMSVKQLNGTQLLTVQIHDFFLAAWNRMQTEFGNCDNGGSTWNQNRLYSGRWYCVPGSLQQISTNTFSLQSKNQHTVGSFVTYQQSAYNGGAYLFYTSGNVTLQNTVNHASNGVAYSTALNYGPIIFRNASIMPNPTPGSDGQLQIQTTIINGFNCVGDKEAPTIEGCTIIGTGDDSIDIGSKLYSVVQVLPAQNAIVVSAEADIQAYVQAGDALTLYTPDLDDLGTAVAIQSAFQVTGPYIPPGTYDTSLYDHSVTFDGATFFQINFESMPPAFASAPFDSIASLVSRATYAKVIGNYIFNNQGRGISVHGNNAYIQGNVVDPLAEAGLTIGGDTHYAEGVFPHNVTIRDNIITNFFGMEITDFGFYTANPINQNINIINNTLIVQQNPIAVNSGGQITVTGNTLHNCLCGSALGLWPSTNNIAWSDSYKAFTFVNITGLTLTGNVITQDTACAATNNINWGAPVQLTAVTDFVSDNSIYQLATDVLTPAAPIMSPGKLFSSNGNFYLAVQSDGNLCVYNNTVDSEQQPIWCTNTWMVSKHPPFTLSMNSACDAQMHDSNGLLVVDFKNYGPSTAPCTLQMRNDGTVAIIDAENIVFSIDAAPVLPQATSGMLMPGQTLQQGIPLNSTDGTVFLLLQSDGNLVLYNSQLANEYPQSAASIIWQSGTSGSTPGPFSALMQEDCNFVLHNGNFGTSSSSQVVWTTSTYGQGAPLCQLQVSGANGGTVSIVNTKGAVVFQQPTTPSTYAVDRLVAGQSLAAGWRLYSPNGKYFLTLQPDDNVILYSTALYQKYGASSPAAVAGLPTYGLSSNYPITLNMLTNCNAALLDKSHNLVYSTANTNRGVAPCRLQVLNSGAFVINDANGVTWNVNNSPVLANPTSGTLTSGQLLTQGVQLASTDGKIFLSANADGSLTLFNTAAYNQFGETPAAEIWTSNTAGTPGGPFTALLQEDCTLALYSSSYATSGPQAANKVFSTSTSGTVSPLCTLTLSSANGGSFSIVDTAGRVVFTTVGVPLPGSFSLASGSSLVSGSNLYSPNGQYFLSMQSDGNLCIYNSAVYQSSGQGPAYMWGTGTYGKSNNPPFSLQMLSNCDAVIRDSKGVTIYDFGNTNRGTAPCSLEVANIGAVVITDALNATWNLNGAPVSANPTSGALSTGTLLSQGVRLASPDGKVFLTPQSDGNVVLYNAAAFNTYGTNNPAAVIWTSNTGGASSRPFTAVLNDDCTLSLFNSGFASSGPVSANKVYSTPAPSSFKPTCSLAVSSANGGSFAITDASGAVAFTTVGAAAAIATMLAQGASLPSGSSLYSANGQYFLSMQSDGNLCIYNSAIYKASGQNPAYVWGTGTYGKSNYPPYSLQMLSNCDAVIRDSKGNTIYDFGNAQKGTTPCHLQVTNNGSVAIVDAAGITWSLDAQPVAPAGTSSTLTPGFDLQQGGQLFSPDGSVYLGVNTDGSFGLYNTKDMKTYPGSLAGTIWTSGTSGSTPGPFSLLMQEDCNLVLYNGNYLQANGGGPIGQNAVWASNTGGKGAPMCTAAVSSANGGALTVTDSTGKQLFSVPPAGSPQYAIDTITAGQTLPMGGRLWSQSGQYYLVAQPDANLVLYKASGAAVWAANTYGKSSHTPITFNMQSDCNAVLRDSIGAALWSTSTSGQGVAPCHLQVLNAGTFSVIDSHNTVLATF